MSRYPENPDPDRSGSRSRTDPRADPEPNSGLKKNIYILFFFWRNPNFQRCAMAYVISTAPHTTRRKFELRHIAYRLTKPPKKKKNQNKKKKKKLKKKKKNFNFKKKKKKKIKKKKIKQKNNNKKKKKQKITTKIIKSINRSKNKVTKKKKKKAAIEIK